MGCISFVSLLMTVVGKFVARVRLYVLRIRLPKKIKRRTTIKHDIFIRAADGSPFLQLQLCSFAHYPPGTWPEVSLGSKMPRTLMQNQQQTVSLTDLQHRLLLLPFHPPSFIIINIAKHARDLAFHAYVCLFLYVLTLAIRLVSPIYNIHRIK